jgi:hypothetical protein
MKIKKNNSVSRAGDRRRTGLTGCRQHRTVRNVTTVSPIVRKFYEGLTKATDLNIVSVPRAAFACMQFPVTVTQHMNILCGQNVDLSNVLLSEG